MWKCPSACRRDASGQSGDSERITSSKSSALERWADWCCSDFGVVGTNRYEVPGRRGATKDGLRSHPPDRSIAPTSVLPNRF